MIKRIIDEIKVTKYNFENRLNACCDKEVKWYDRAHQLTTRFFSRINMDIKTFIKKVKKGLEYLDKTDIWGDVNIHFIKSNFRLVVKKTPENYFIITFLTSEQKPKRGDLVLDIDEAYELGIIDDSTYEECKNNDTFSSYLTESTRSEFLNKFYNVSNSFIEPDSDGAKVYIQTIEIDE